MSEAEAQEAQGAEHRTEAQRQYDEYLQSEHWQTMRQRALWRWGEHCQRCGYRQPLIYQSPLVRDPLRLPVRDAEARLYANDVPTPFSDPYPVLPEDLSTHRRTIGLAEEVRDQAVKVRAIHVHHLTYLRRGREDLNHDLAVLCDRCHEWAHTPAPEWCITVGPPGWEEGMQNHGRSRFARLLQQAGREVAMDYAATFEANANKWLLWNGWQPQFELQAVGGLQAKNAERGAK